MLNATLGTYGAPFVDENAVSNPTTQESASLHNRLTEDVAQMTRACPRAWVQFKTNTTSNPPAGDVTHVSVWGTGDAQKPTVTRTGTGLYTITYATTYADGLASTETVGFMFARADVMTNDNNDYEAKVKSVSANVITLAVFDAAGTPALSDLSGTAFVLVTAR